MRPNPDGAAGASMRDEHDDDANDDDDHDHDDDGDDDHHQDDDDDDESKVLRALRAYPATVPTTQYDVQYVSRCLRRLRRLPLLHHH